MHPHDLFRLADRAINNSVLLLSQALGDTSLVLLTETGSMDLWLLAEVRRDRPEVTYLVTDGPRGQYTKSLTFKTLDEARGTYEDIRATHDEIGADTWKRDTKPKGRARLATSAK